MSALAPKADMSGAQAHVCLAQKRAGRPAPSPRIDTRIRFFCCRSMAMPRIFAAPLEKCDVLLAKFAFGSTVDLENPESRAIPLRYYVHPLAILRSSRGEFRALLASRRYEIAAHSRDDLKLPACPCARHSQQARPSRRRQWYARPLPHPGRCQPEPPQTVVSASPQLYSINSSARSSSGSGELRPSALAVLRLITSSNFTGCSIGKSAGFAPFKTFCT